MCCYAAEPLAEAVLDLAARERGLLNILGVQHVVAVPLMLEDTDGPRDAPTCLGWLHVHNEQMARELIASPLRAPSTSGHESKRGIYAGCPLGLLSSEMNYLQTERFSTCDRSISGRLGRASVLRGFAATTGCRRGFAVDSPAGSVRDAREAGGRTATKYAGLQGL